MSNALLEVSWVRSFKVLQLEIVEVSGSIRCSPQSNHSVADCLVGEIEDLLVIEDVYSIIFMGNPPSLRQWP